ncbi:hypothetical protein D8S93_09325 [Vibrio sp. VGrn 2]|uniref:hypothetical protein n=1 Tax=Vibrio sp. VGrn 2 TaxID=2419839 RepID=UPI00128C978E|nr:hypothetical protein [Vibrio sp. VGrn 2]MPS38833.1 hypothetical protein [Vibrio sp. VGrn 2]
MINIARFIIKDIKEENISFLHGNRSDYMFSLEGEGKFKANLLFQFVKFIYVILEYYKSLSLDKSNIDSDVLFYATTKNQYESLMSTYNSSVKIGMNCCWIYNDKKLISSHTSIKVPLKKTEAIKIFITTFFLLFTLACSLVNRVGLKRANSHAANLFLPYFFIPYFLVLLSKRKASLVVLANDHSADTRSIKYVCDFYGIKTAYIQHASISKNYPVLDFDYCFLDGKSALKTYLDIFEDQFECKLIKNRRCRVYLSGQKKSINIKPLSLSKKYMGLAINNTIDKDYILRFLSKCNEQNINCIVRLHPAQSAEIRDVITSISKTLNVDISISDAKTESVNDYFSRISALTSTDSSIILEAALFGLPVLYYYCSNSKVEYDYYGFLEKEICTSLNIEDIKGSIAKANDKNRVVNKRNALREYSATYQTAWQGREGELVALAISELLSKKFTKQTFHFEENFYSIYKVYALNEY